MKYALLVKSMTFTDIGFAKGVLIGLEENIKALPPGQRRAISKAIERLDRATGDMIKHMTEVDEF